MMEIKRPFQQDCLKPSEDVTVSDLQYLSQMILADQKAAVNGGMRKKIRKKNSFLASKRDSLFIPTKSIEAPGSSFKMSKRDSFLIASELLGFRASNEVFDEQTLDDIQEPLFNESSTRSSVHVTDKISKRDSFLVTMENLEYPKLDNTKRRVSQLLLSELLDTDKLSELDAKALIPMTPTSQMIGVQCENGRKRKLARQNSSLTFTEGDIFKKANENDEHNPSKKKKFSFYGTNHVSLPKPDLNLSSAIESSCEKSVESENNKVPNSIAKNPSNTLISLCQAMKSSEESQTRIHLWDKKMGLRRSHSKTMRNSMRSREKLLKFCSNQILMTL